VMLEAVRPVELISFALGLESGIEGAFIIQHKGDQ
jgi:hypothetical protein